MLEYSELYDLIFPGRSDWIEQEEGFGQQTWNWYWIGMGWSSTGSMRRRAKLRLWVEPAGGLILRQQTLAERTGRPWSRRSR
jgi:hypothetical protein